MYTTIDKVRKHVSPSAHSRSQAVLSWKWPDCILSEICSDAYMLLLQASAHMKGGAKKVVISAPSADGMQLQHTSLMIRSIHVH